MPFKSRAQQRWGHTAAGEKALGGAEAVHEWDEATKKSGKRLPARGYNGAISERVRQRFESGHHNPHPRHGHTGHDHLLRERREREETHGIKSRAAFSTSNRPSNGIQPSLPMYGEFGGREGGDRGVSSYYGGPSSRSTKDDIPGVSR
jgi:hypothetical protein